MYCKQDYAENFNVTDKSAISHKQYLKLFRLCIPSNAMKVAINIYLRHMTQTDILKSDLDLLMTSLKTD